jgi:Matrixin
MKRGYRTWMRTVGARLVAGLLMVSLSFGFCFVAAPRAYGYAFDEIVPDVRQPLSLSGGSAWPVRARQLTAPGSVTLRWSTVLGTAPVAIITQNQTPEGQLNEIERVITESLAVWTGVNGTSLTAASVAPLTRVAAANACGSDGVNSICFDQPDGAFTPGVLAFTRVITADRIGVQVGAGAPATEVGQILDADIYFNPWDAQVSYATPAALASSPRSYDLESLLTHEMGHFLGFSHSAVWNAMMYPYAPAPGTFTGTRPAAQRADAPLGDDDRTGLRACIRRWRTR